MNQIQMHMSEGELVRLLDRQLAADQERVTREHLLGCDACRARLEELAAQSDAFAARMRELDRQIEPDQLTRARARAAMRSAQRRAPARRLASRGWFRAAAAAALIAVTTATVEPLRAWVSDRWEDLTATDDPAVVATEQPTLIERGTRVGFQTPGPVFVLEMASAQPAGELRLRIADVEQAQAQTLNGQESFLVLPSGLKVENTPGSRADYEITLPAGTEIVQVFVEGRPVVVTEVPADAELPWTLTVPLQE